MKLDTINTEVKKAVDVPELISCVFKHKVSETSATIDYKGPKISKAVWDEVLAFLQWTYDTWKSESQLRLYVNSRTREWKAWAFPQEANTGMSAREILDSEVFKTQRAQFSDGDGWLYFGTVHHHCSAGAFQSGTDEANERNQDGLHITIGNMDKAKYDIHSRFYLTGNKFTPDLETFFDITEALASVPMALRSLVRTEDVAKQLMTTPPPAGTAINALWKENVVSRSAAITPYNHDAYLGHREYNVGNNVPRNHMEAAGFKEVRPNVWVKDYSNNGNGKKGKKNKHKTHGQYALLGVEDTKNDKARRCIKFITDECKLSGMAQAGLDSLIKFFNENIGAKIVADNLSMQQLTWDDLMEYMVAEEVGAAASPEVTGGSNDRSLEDYEARQLQAWEGGM